MEIKCPRCGSGGEFRIVRTVTKENLEELYSMDMFTYTCPDCGYRTNVDHDAAYNDPEGRIMVIYGDTPLVDEITNDHLVRIVRSQNELAEKVHILEQGRDDRIVELMKILISAGLMKARDLTDFRVVYDVYEGSEQFAAVQDDGGIILLKWDEALYDSLCEQYLDTLPPMRNREEFIIDRDWAIKRIRM